MLGWSISIYRHINNPILNKTEAVLIAQWETSVYGICWIDDLVKEGKAKDLGRFGYPSRYSITAGVLLPIIKSGLPSHDSPLVIGDDYIMPEGWNSELQIDLQKLSDCPSDEILFIHAWDQS